MTQLNFKNGVARISGLTGVSMAEASRKKGHKNNWIASMIGRNNPSLRNIEEVADAFDVSVIELLKQC